MIDKEQEVWVEDGAGGFTPEPIEGQVQLPMQKERMFFGENCYQEALNFLAWAVPIRVNVEFGHTDTGEQACRVTYQANHLQ